jgi:hypothetical protein
MPYFATNLKEITLKNQFLSKKSFSDTKSTFSVTFIVTIAIVL